MADSGFGERDIYIDLTIAGARVIRDAADNALVKIKSIRINGTAGAGGPGDIILRKESASGGIEFKAIAATGSTFDGETIFDTPAPVFKGLYMDALTNAWQAGSFMMIYTA